MKPFRVLLFGALLALLTTTSLSAQLSTAQLSGRVADQSGAILPGVTVTATQTDTGVMRSVVTDENGTYVLPNLPTGPYRLEAMLQGFRTYSQTGIVLQVAAAPVINVSMAIGSLEETVSVEAAAPLVDVQSAGIGDVVDNERIVELPLQGRQVTDLIMLAGAAVQTATGGARIMNGGVRISVAGGLPNGIAYLLDGASHNNPQSNTNLPMPFPDALQEFRVATSGLSAQNGMHGSAAVNAVTKSGTNTFHGIGFEFLRDRHLNARSPFAAIGPDGEKQDDGLKRNQFGGTFGGPIVRDRLFFFGAYQGTQLRYRPADQIAWVPNAAMLAGDFTAVASAACAGRQITLGGGFVNNRISPALFSPAALNIAKRLPTSTDPCGEIKYTTSDDSDEAQPLTRIDFQMSDNHSAFGRYMATLIDEQPAFEGGSDNILKTQNPGADNRADSLTLGDTMVFGPSMVNAFRFAYNHTRVNRYSPAYFDPSDVGIKLYPYYKGQMPLSVTGAFATAGGANTNSLLLNDFFQVADDVTLVRGRHQFGIGVNIARSEGKYQSTSRAAGTWIIDGRASGLGLADFLLGRVTSVEHGAVQNLPVHNWYLGAYGQDTWRLTERLTLNLGVRWEPYFGQHVDSGAVSIFDIDNFRAGAKSTVYVNAPAGLIYPGDAGFPDGKTGLNKQWANISPRLGAAWDVRGDGRMALRASYALAYDFVAGEYHNINSSAPPFGNRSLITDPPGRMDDPYGHIGGDPHPITTNRDVQYLQGGAFGTMDPNINSPRIQNWNLTFERQFGSSYGVAVSYLGSYSDRLWSTMTINPGVFLGLGPCTINNVAYPVCSTNANLNLRRVLYRENPREGVFFGVIDENDDLGRQEYHGLKLSGQRRAANGLSFSGNYTFSKCVGTETPATFNQLSSGFVKPGDPEYDRGLCSQDHRHIATVTLGAESPSIEGGLGMLVSRWRASGIVSMRDGNTINIITGLDTAFTGVRNQRPNQVSDDLYASERTLSAYFNRAAFATPEPGGYGNLPRNAARGPNYWNVDLAVSRSLAIVGTQALELRIEAFNLFNTFNWGDPADAAAAGGALATLSSAQFGRITTQAGAPRIMQLGIKYSF